MSFLEAKEFRIINREDRMIKCMMSCHNGTQSSLFVEANSRMKRKGLVSPPWRRRAGEHTVAHSLIYLLLRTFPVFCADAHAAHVYLVLNVENGQGT